MSTRPLVASSDYDPYARKGAELPQGPPHWGAAGLSFADPVAALAEARKRAGLSQSEPARALGERQQFVSTYESGERRLDLIEFVDVARALGLDWARLLEDAVSSDANSRRALAAIPSPH